MNVQGMLGAAALVAGLGMSGAAHAATFNGETLQIFQKSPTVNQNTIPETVVVDGSKGVLEIDYDDNLGGVEIDIAGDLITFTNYVNGPFLGTSFNGFQIVDILGSIDAFTGLTFVSGIGDFPVSSTWFDDDNLFFNFLNPNPVLKGASVTYRVSFASIPLPASAWLLLAALGGMGAVARRKRLAA